MARRSFMTIIKQHQYTSYDFRNEPLLPVRYANPAGLPGLLTAHFAHSRTCALVKSALQITWQAPPLRRDSTPTDVLTIADLIDGIPATRLDLCHDCFTGPGAAQLAKWSCTPSAPPSLTRFYLRAELTDLTHRATRIRRGHLAHTLFAKREAPTVLRRIATARTTIAQLNDSVRADNSNNIAAFERAANALIALIAPHTTTYALDALRAQLTEPPYAWAVLDETPTILALESVGGYSARWTPLAPELLAALTLSDPGAPGRVLYGPRFAIDYVQRTYGSASSYVLATTEPDPAVASLAAGIWGIRSGIPDLFAALATARTLAATTHVDSLSPNSPA
jgi:hypothetical protein